LNYYIRIYFFVLVSFCLSGCFSRDRSIQNISSRNQVEYEQTLSGNGRIIAYFIEEDQQQIIRIKDLRNGKIMRLRYLSRYKNYSSPSLSWNGKYIAAITQIGDKKTAVIEDLIGGRFYRISNYNQGANPVSLSLSPEAKMIVIQFKSSQRQFLEFFDLTNRLQPDLMRGSASTNYSP
tara:strand:+ start:283 stop:816 length:534 start_codon:yes stop_codon:yes gene_type:complete